MRICYIALGNFPHVDAYLDYFRKKEHDVHFVALTPSRPREVPTQVVGGDGAFLRAFGKLAYLPAMLRARAVVRSLSPDVIHAHYATSAGLAALLCGCHPWIVTAHGTDVTAGVRSSIWRFLLRQIFLKADCVNPVSPGLRQMVLNLGIPEDRIETLSMGIDPQLFRFTDHSRTAPHSPAKLICTRSFEPVYNHETIIKGMAILKERGVPFNLTLVGKGFLRSHLEGLVKELGVADRITFAGAVPNVRLPEYLAQHDIYLSASLHDGTSLSLLEAMSGGLYPIVSDIRANTEWITNDQNGLLHKTTDPEHLADCIVSYASCANSAKDVLLCNRQLVIEKGDRNRNMERLERIYLGLLNSRKALHNSSSFRGAT
jgi:glycosyltransferase involved in cell wall biosynthesis